MTLKKTFFGIVTKAFAFLILTHGLQATASGACAPYNVLSNYIGATSINGIYEINISGDIGVDDAPFATVMSKYNGERTIHIMLNTPGGLVKDAEVLVAAITQWKNNGARVVVEVSENGSVESAGVLILAAASQVIFDPTAKVGLHAASSTQIEIDEQFNLRRRQKLDEDGTRDYLTQLTTIGVDTAWLGHLLNSGAFSKLEMTCLSREELTGSNLLK